MKRNLGKLALVLLLVLLAACGGGGGSSSAGVWDRSNWDSATWQ
jgi:hypothetical protein